MPWRGMRVFRRRAVTETSPRKAYDKILRGETLLDPRVRARARLFLVQQRPWNPCQEGSVIHAEKGSRTFPRERSPASRW